MDVYSDYNQIPMFPKKEDKTSFITDKGLYCYKVVPFELKNVEATYQKLVNSMFADLISKIMEVYIDDMLVKNLQAMDHVKTPRGHLSNFEKIKDGLNPFKYAFGVASGKFLGYLVNQGEIKVNLEKIKTLIEMDHLRNSRKYRASMGE